ncbi:MAG TPA: ABC transporter permease [Acidimicrobiales bacterium]|nr:ABC transporter permease [Acidimicrobiales bacterium]
MPDRPGPPPAGAVTAQPAGVVTARPAPARRPTPLWLRAVGYWAYQYKRTWRSSITTSFLYPVLYLAAMGVGLGSLIDRHAHLVDGVPYLDFVAPGLLAATAMQIGANESMYPVMAAIKWVRTYLAMLATPLRVVDVLRGHLAWIGIRLATVSAIYLVVVAAFGVVRSPLAVLALPAAVLSGLAFAAPIAAFAATQEKDVGFTSIYRLVLVPLFLFSGTFFPVAELPGWLQPVAYATPLYHGVDLCRGLVLGTAGPGTLWDVAYLVTVAAAGYVAATVTFRRRLVV